MRAASTDASVYAAEAEAVLREVSGPVSLLRSALRRVRTRIDAVNAAVDAEEPEAEVLLEELPGLRRERARLELVLEPLARREAEAEEVLLTCGIAPG